MALARLRPAARVDPERFWRPHHELAPGMSCRPYTPHTWVSAAVARSPQATHRDERRHDDGNRTNPRGDNRRVTASSPITTSRGIRVRDWIARADSSLLWL